MTEPHKRRCQHCDQAILETQPYEHVHYVYHGGREADEWAHRDCAAQAIRETYPQTDDISGRLYDLRLSRGWTHAQVAERVGTAKSVVSGWETPSGRATHPKCPSPKHALKLAEIYGVDVWWLWNGAPSPEHAYPYDARLAELQAQNIDLGDAVRGSQEIIAALRKDLASAIAALRVEHVRHQEQCAAALTALEGL